MTTATVETLTAEVRVLMVGNRQVTLSVAKQLDTCPWAEMTPMGRVRIQPDDDWVREGTVIGRSQGGSLVKTRVAKPSVQLNAEGFGVIDWCCVLHWTQTLDRRAERLWGKRQAVVDVDVFKLRADSRRPLEPRDCTAKPAFAFDSALHSYIAPIMDAYFLADETWSAASNLPLIVLAGLK